MFSTSYNKEEKLWYGPNLQPLYNPDVSIGRVLLSSLRAHSSKIAQIGADTGIEMTFEQIRLNSIRAAQNFQARGYKQKQVFGFMARNSQNVAPITIASMAIACPVSTVDPSFGRIELLNMLEVTRPVLMFCDVSCYDLLTKCLAELRIVAKIFTFGGTVGQSEPVENLFAETHKEHQFIPAIVDGTNETAMIVCSSGTTGSSKGVCISHASLLHGVSEFFFPDSRNVMICSSSLYWVSGLITLLVGTVFGLKRIITTDIFAPELLLELIEKYKISITFNAPHQIVQMMKHENFSKTDISSLACLLVGGSKVPQLIKSEMKTHIPNAQVVVGFGMSEIAAALTLDYPSTNKPDTTGRLAPKSCVKIIDSEGNRLGINEDGEICIKMCYKFVGYYGNKKATDEFFDAEGFILSGDIGHFDEDGDLFVVDRKKDMIKYCNYQVSPSEIDAYLTESPDIKSACVVGIPDPAVTDLPAAVVVSAEGSTISEKEVFDIVADHFADFYKLRGGVYFMDKLPETPSGKILRREVREIATALYNAKKHK